MDAIRDCCEAGRNFQIACDGISGAMLALKDPGTSFGIILLLHFVYPPIKVARKNLVRVTCTYVVNQ